MKDAIRKQLKMPISSKPKKQQLYYLYKMIMNRRTFEYKMRHTLRYYFKCFCLRSNKSLKQIKDGKRDVYFDLASRKLDKDLDVITLLRIMQTADQAQKIIFD